MRRTPQYHYSLLALGAIIASWATPLAPTAASAAPPVVRTPAELRGGVHATTSDTLTWSTESMLVAFEDLKKFSWADWDYNDFLVRITTSRGIQADGGIAQVEIDYTALARGAGFLDHAFKHHMPFIGGGSYTLEVKNASGVVVRSESQAFTEDEPTITVFDSTRTALPPGEGLVQTNTPGEQHTFIPGYTAHVTFTLSDPSSNLDDVSVPVPWDPYLYVVQTGESIHLIQPGYLDNTQKVTVPNSPLLGYDLPLAYTFDPSWRWPLETNGIWKGYTKFTTYIKRGGTQARNWSDSSQATPAWLWNVAIPGSSRAARDTSTPPTSSYFASPTVADITGDGTPEILIGNQLANRMEVYNAARQTVPGWSQPVGGSIRAAATVADITGDGKPEVLVGASDGKLYAWHADGSAVAGWPVKLGDYRVLASAVVGDLDADGTPEIVVPLADGKLYALTPGGAAKAGWPVSIGDVADEYESQVANSSPKIADLDGDGHPEVVVGSTDGKLYVFNGDGSLRWSYASGDMVLGAPAVGELNAATAGKEIVFASGDRYVYLLDAQGNRIWRRPTGWTVRSTPTLADLDGDGKDEILVGGDDDKLWAWHADGTRVAGWPQATQGDVFSSPSVGDIDGDGKPEVVVGCDDGYVYAWHTDGTAVTEWPLYTSQTVKGTPALTNLDDDAADEIVVGDMGGVLNAWGTATQPAKNLNYVMLPLVTAP